MPKFQYQESKTYLANTHKNCQPWIFWGYFLHQLFAFFTPKFPHYLKFLHQIFTFLSKFWAREKKFWKKLVDPETDQRLTNMFLRWWILEISTGTCNFDKNIGKNFKNPKFPQKLKFCKKSKFSSKIKMLVKDQNCGQK